MRSLYVPRRAASAALGVMLCASLIFPGRATAGPVAASLDHAGVGRSAALIAENNLPGTTKWRIITQSAHHEIEGYASSTSIERGRRIDFYINTIGTSYRMDIYRMGWYGGKGGRLMMSVASLPGVRQPACRGGALGLISCAWRRSYTLTAPETWLSGVYLAKLEINTTQPPLAANAPHRQSYIIFVVRDDASRSAILFQTSVTSYEAYNAWGGRLLYNRTVHGKVIPRAYAVSFDRPYDRGWGAGDFFYWEYPMLKWIERNGYDVTYDTDLDTDSAPNLLPQHRAFLVVGHDEYWSTGMRNNVENAIRHGVSVGFFAANVAYNRVRFKSSALGPRRIMICYKDIPLDPNFRHRTDLVTTQWRTALIGRPEQTMIGQMSDSWFNAPYFALRPVHTNTWPYAGTGLHDGSSVPGLVGYEYDRVFANVPKPKGDLILAASPVVTFDHVHSVSNMTLYTAPSGARVFSAGTIVWSWGLDNDEVNAGINSWSYHHIASPAIQRFTANILNNFTGAQGITT